MNELPNSCGQCGRSCIFRDKGLVAPRRIFNLPRLRIGTFIGILHLLVSILGAGLISLFALYFIYHTGEQSSLREMENLAYSANNALDDPYSTVLTAGDARDEIEGTLNHYLKNHPNLRYTILCSDGQPLFDDAATRQQMDARFDAPEVRLALTDGNIGQSIRRDALGKRNIFVALPVNHGCSANGVLIMAAPFDLAMEPTYHAMLVMGVIALLIVAFTVVEGRLGSAYISSPLINLSHVAYNLSQGDLSARAVCEGPVEVTHLARTLNTMAGRLQTNLDALRGFVANASHELRTPLTSLKLQVGALRSGAYEEPEIAEHFLEQMDSEIDRLIHTVNDMLDLSQMESGNTVPNFQAVDLVDLISEVQAFWDARLRQAGLTLTTTSEAEMPKVKGDPYQLRRLFDNLVDNAVKHTPAGGQIDILLGRCPPESGNRLPESSNRPPEGGNRLPDFVRVEIRDTGVGIAPEHLPNIFDRFYRVERLNIPRGERPVGSGLGLAIARSIINTHGGQIGVTSQLGVGSTFWVELPVV